MGPKHARPAADFLAELEKDPRYVEMSRRQDAEDARMMEQFNRDSAPILADLKRAGLRVESLSDLSEMDIGADGYRVGGGPRYDRSLPVLIDHLEHPNSEHVATVLASLLAVPGAKPYWHRLKSLYQTETRELPKNEIARALATSVSDQTIDELIELIRDRGNGESRLYLLLSFDRGGGGPRVASQFLPKLASVIDELALDPQLEPIVSRLRLSPRPRAPRFPHQATVADTTGLIEVSGSFDVRSLDRFVEGLVRLKVGFRQSFAAELRKAVGALDVDEEMRFEFPLGPEGTRLVVVVHMDDADAPDVWMYTSHRLAEKLFELIVGVTESVDS